MREAGGWAVRTFERHGHAHDGFQVPRQVVQRHQADAGVGQAQTPQRRAPGAHGLRAQVLLHLGRGR